MHTFRNLVINLMTLNKTQFFLVMLISLKPCQTVILEETTKINVSTRNPRYRVNIAAKVYFRCQNIAFVVVAAAATAAWFSRRTKFSHFLAPQTLGNQANASLIWLHCQCHVCVWFLRGHFCFSRSERYTSQKWAGKSPIGRLVKRKTETGLNKRLVIKGFLLMLCRRSTQEGP